MILVAASMLCTMAATLVKSVCSEARCESTWSTANEHTYSFKLKYLYRADEL